MRTETPPPDGSRVSDALPPVPLTDELLSTLLSQDKIVAVHIPDDRPETVQTLAGTHQGDILEFYIETTSIFVKFRYDMAPGGLSWHRCDPWKKDDQHIELLESDLESYHQLRGTRRETDRGDSDT